MDFRQRLGLVGDSQQLFANMSNPRMNTYWRQPEFGCSRQGASYPFGNVMQSQQQQVCVSNMGTTQFNVMPNRRCVPRASSYDLSRAEHNMTVAMMLMRGQSPAVGYNNQSLSSHTQTQRMPSLSQNQRISFHTRDQHMSCHSQNISVPVINQTCSSMQQLCQKNIKPLMSQNNVRSLMSQNNMVMNTSQCQHRVHPQCMNQRMLCQRQTSRNSVCSQGIQRDSSSVPAETWSTDCQSTNHKENADVRSQYIMPIYHDTSSFMKHGVDNKLCQCSDNSCQFQGNRMSTTRGPSNNRLHSALRGNYSGNSHDSGTREHNQASSSVSVSTEALEIERVVTCRRRVTRSRPRSETADWHHWWKDDENCGQQTVTLETRKTILRQTPIHTVFEYNHSRPVFTSRDKTGESDCSETSSPDNITKRKTEFDQGSLKPQISTLSVTCVTKEKKEEECSIHEKDSLRSNQQIVVKDYNHRSCVAHSLEKSCICERRNTMDNKSMKKASDRGIKASRECHGRKVTELGRSFVCGSEMRQRRSRWGKQKTDNEKNNAQMSTCILRENANNILVGTYKGEYSKTKANLKKTGCEKADTVMDAHSDNKRTSLDTPVSKKLSTKNNLMKPRDKEQKHRTESGLHQTDSHFTDSVVGACKRQVIGSFLVSAGVKENDVSDIVEKSSVRRDLNTASKRSWPASSSLTKEFDLSSEIFHSQRPGNGRYTLSLENAPRFWSPDYRFMTSKENLSEKSLNMDTAGRPATNGHISKLKQFLPRAVHLKVLSNSSRAKPELNVQQAFKSPSKPYTESSRMASCKDTLVTSSDYVSKYSSSTEPDKQKLASEIPPYRLQSTDCSDLSGDRHSTPVPTMSCDVSRAGHDKPAAGRKGCNLTITLVRGVKAKKQKSAEDSVKSVSEETKSIMSPVLRRTNVRTCILSGRKPTKQSHSVEKSTIKAEHTRRTRSVECSPVDQKLLRDVRVQVEDLNLSRLTRTRLPRMCLGDRFSFQQRTHASLGKFSGKTQEYVKTSEGRRSCGSSLNKQKDRHKETHQSSEMSKIPLNEDDADYVSTVNTSSKVTDSALQELNKGKKLLVSTSASSNAGGLKRKRGRPPGSKNKLCISPRNVVERWSRSGRTKSNHIDKRTPVQQLKIGLSEFTSVCSNTASDPDVKRKRGRPQGSKKKEIVTNIKVSLHSRSLSSTFICKDQVVKRKPGRPPGSKMKKFGTSASLLTSKMSRRQTQYQCSQMVGSQSVQIATVKKQRDADSEETKTVTSIRISSSVTKESSVVPQRLPLSSETESSDASVTPLKISVPNEVEKASAHCKVKPLRIPLSRLTGQHTAVTNAQSTDEECSASNHNPAPTLKMIFLKKGLIKPGDEQEDVTKSEQLVTPQKITGSVVTKKAAEPPSVTSQGIWQQWPSPDSARDEDSTNALASRKRKSSGSSSDDVLGGNVPITDDDPVQKKTRASISNVLLNTCDPDSDCELFLLDKEALDVCNDPVLTMCGDGDQEERNILDELVAAAAAGDNLTPQDTDTSKQILEKACLKHGREKVTTDVQNVNKQLDTGSEKQNEQKQSKLPSDIQKICKPLKHASYMTKAHKHSKHAFEMPNVHKQGKHRKSHDKERQYHSCDALTRHCTHHCSHKMSRSLKNSDVTKHDNHEHCHRKRSPSEELEICKGEMNSKRQKLLKEGRRISENRVYMNKSANEQVDGMSVHQKSPKCDKSHKNVSGDVKTKSKSMRKEKSNTENKKSESVSHGALKTRITFNMIQGDQLSQPQLRLRTCLYCHSFSTRLEQIMKEHIKGIHPYRCRNCRIAFKDQLETKAHRLTHHLQEVHHCMLCHQVLLSEYTYRKHIQSKAHLRLMKAQKEAIDAICGVFFQTDHDSQDNFSATLRRIQAQEGMLWDEGRLKGRKALPAPGNGASPPPPQPPNLSHLRHFYYDNPELERALEKFQEFFRAQKLSLQSGQAQNRTMSISDTQEEMFYFPLPQVEDSESWTITSESDSEIASRTTRVENRDILEMSLSEVLGAAIADWESPEHLSSSGDTVVADDNLKYSKDACVVVHDGYMKNTGQGTTDKEILPFEDLISDSTDLRHPESATESSKFSDTDDMMCHGGGLLPLIASCNVPGQDVNEQSVQSVCVMKEVKSTPLDPDSAIKSEVKYVPGPLKIHSNTGSNVTTDREIIENNDLFSDSEKQAHEGLSPLFQTMSLQSATSQHHLFERKKSDEISSTHLLKPLFVPSADSEPLSVTNSDEVPEPLTVPACASQSNCDMNSTQALIPTTITSPQSVDTERPSSAESLTALTWPSSLSDPVSMDNSLQLPKPLSLPYTQQEPLTVSSHLSEQLTQPMPELEPLQVPCALAVSCTPIMESSSHDSDKTGVQSLCSIMATGSSSGSCISTTTPVSKDASIPKTSTFCARDLVLTQPCVENSDARPVNLPSEEISVLLKMEPAQ